MKWIIRMHWPEHEEYTTPERNEEYTIPFDAGQTVYYAHKKKWWKKKSPWVITKSYVTGMFATHAYGVTLNNGENIWVADFKHLFTDRDEAIDFCLKNNERNKVKIYGE